MILLMGCHNTLALLEALQSKYYCIVILMCMCKTGNHLNTFALDLLWICGVCSYVCFFILSKSSLCLLFRKSLELNVEPGRLTFQNAGKMLNWRTISLVIVVVDRSVQKLFKRLVFFMIMLMLYMNQLILTYWIQVTFGIEPVAVVS